MRFVVSVWVLVLSALLLFTGVTVSHQVLAPLVSAEFIRIFTLASAWGIGLVSAAAMHILYRRVARATEKAARDQTVVQLAGAVAHELNQPLTVVISGADLLSHRNHSPEEMRAVAANMAEASERMADIVAKLQRATHYSAKPYVGSVQIVDLEDARDNGQEPGQKKVAAVD